ncbi:MAG TPA: hypothetical protein VE263_19795 [Candidatus Angelobacter sp.]|nr:hypothetical protein [Candidatus Angelobacter sp.]
MNNTMTQCKRSLFLLAAFFALGLLSLLAPAGCKRSGHTSDPRLRQIDEMLDSQLPAGTPKSRVMVYLNSQGFSIENSDDPHAMVATVHHVDTETLQPVNARVTFHFDSEDKLKTYDLAGQ